MRFTPTRIVLLLELASLAASAGCLHPCEYFRNGCKVGPNYSPPAAAVEQHWLDVADRRVRDDRQVPCYWWGVFNDPVLCGLVGDAADQNLTLRQAGFRVLQARDQLCITTGNVFPPATRRFWQLSSSGQQRRLL